MPLEIKPRSRPKHLMVADAHPRSTADPKHSQGVVGEGSRRAEGPPQGMALTL
jgi:hypothetical protein